MNATADRERLARIETKLDALLEAKADQESRLRALERWMWGLTGGTALNLAGALAAVVRLA